MREIIFRAKKNGKWYFGNYVNSYTTYFAKENHKSIFLAEPAQKESHWVEDVDVETIGQFTGLCDSVGNPIYEGDILRFGNSPNGVCEVKWNEVIAAFCIRFLYFERYLGVRPLGDWMGCERSIEIIGNIHDNPELLKGGEK